MRFTTRLSELAGCDFIVEDVAEVFAVQRAVHGELDAVGPPEVCFGVNPSCISITRIAGTTGRADRIVGMHFMNPVHVKPAVEVIRGVHTADATLARARALLGALGRAEPPRVAHQVATG